MDNSKYNIPVKNVIPGIENRWEALLSPKIAPRQIAKNAAVSYDEAGNAYILRAFNMEFSFYPKDKTIVSTSPGSDVLLGRLGDFFRLTSLWYLTTAKEIPLTGQLIGPSELKEGEQFFQGSHTLPLGKLGAKYKNDKEAFLNKGRSLGADVISQGDAAIILRPLPRIPVSLILWLEDEEFPADVKILLDASCQHHLPIDMLWSAAMMSTLIMF
ncbi:hypothetical protein MCHI_001973 [Candidatus Magnetoovum chiemensis]|nr:hypothetical protein MCHI_001973 [Candidatus Magnetoovum chiemensis]